MNDQTPVRAHFKTSLLEEAEGEGLNPTSNPTMGEIIARRFSRRGFLQGSLAATAIAATDTMPSFAPSTPALSQLSRPARSPRWGSPGCVANIIAPFFLPARLWKAHPDVGRALRARNATS